MLSSASFANPGRELPEPEPHRLRHDTVILCVAPTANWERRSQISGSRNVAATTPACEGLRGTKPCRNFTFPGLLGALHRGTYATIPNYLERELRYMDAGERGP